jgi:hypothetical protein
MAKKNKKFGIEFSGFEELAADYDKLGGDLKKIVEKCLEVAPKTINPEIKKDMERHRRSGRTERSIVENPKVEWQGNIARIPVGFDISKGGLPSIFLMYGTPRMKPDRKLYNDIYGNAIRKKIGEEQEKILRDAISARLGG